MKYIGCNVEYTDQRNSELLAAYRRYLRHARSISVSHAVAYVVDSPCSRFWVSEERAKIVVAAMLAGREDLRSMRSTKREMFTEIYNRVTAIISESPSVSLTDAVFQVVNSPAPKFYLAPKSAIEILSRIRRGYYKNKCRHKTQ